MRTQRSSTTTALMLTLGLSACAGTNSETRTMTVKPFGELDGQEVQLFTLENANGLSMSVTNYGATVTHLWVPDRTGETADVVLGFDTFEEYPERSPYFGCIAGRCANRIAGGRFSIDGKEYELARNNGPNHLHGGVKGFDKVVWEAAPLESGDAVAFKYRSPAGEEGYPGNVDVVVVYRLTDDDELVVDMKARTDAPTIVNLAHHSYWNLAGHDSGDILGHVLHVNAERYTPADSTLITTGELAPVAGTPFDFRAPKAIGEDIGELPGDGDDPGGYDMNFVINGSPGELRLAAVVHEPGSGRGMEIHTSEPGIQFYTGNFLDGSPGKGGALYPKHSGFCLETQHHPDSIHKEGLEGWPSVVLRPGEEYHHRMVHRFFVK